MTKETKFVVNPLEKYFLDPRRSGARWIIKHKPKFESSATGWDLQVERKNPTSSAPKTCGQFAIQIYW